MIELSLLLSHCVSRTLKIIDYHFSSTATNFAVVEPTSIPILIMFYTMFP